MNPHACSGVIDLNAVRLQRETEAWDRYVAAKARADETLVVEDGLAAGRAWRAFLDLFLAPDQRASLRACDRTTGVGRSR